MTKIIITAGAPYADIDALACAYAYKDLATAKGLDSEIVFVGPLNASVPKSILDWGVDIKKELLDSGDYSFVVVDTSDLAKYPKFVSKDKIIEIYDHHMGYQNQWIGSKSKTKIEEVGACATLIWEEIVSSGMQNQITQLSAKLLYTAIFSNTLNFNAGVTTDRDKIAFKEIEKISGLDTSWIYKYYQETEKGILANPVESIINDSKVIRVPPEDKQIAIGQIELWNSKDFIVNNKILIKNVLSKLVSSDEWFMTAPSISEGKNYLYTESNDMKDLLVSIVGAKFDGDIGTTEKLWLRKEMLKKLLV